MPDYTHLEEVQLTEKAQAALQECAQWLQSAHFKSFGSYEICDESDNLQRKSVEFLLELGTAWAKVSWSHL